MSTSLELSGTLHKVYPADTSNPKFTKREFVIKIEDAEYPQFRKFSLAKNSINEIDKFKPGQTITVSFNPNGREWVDPKTNEPKYFNDDQAWKLAGNGGAPSGNSTPAKPATAKFDAQAFAADDDLPF